jgi:hypothetical protein
MSHKATSEPDHATWRTLYRVGAVAPFVTLLFYLIQILAMAFGGADPTTMEDYVALLQDNQILGLLYLNALDIFSIAFLGTMFLALYVALRQVNRSYLVIAGFFAFLGIAAFVVPRVAMLSVVPLSARYAAATTEAQRTVLLAAIETLGSLGVATNRTIGFLFLTIASLIMSGVMLKSTAFGKTTAYIGIVAAVVTLAIDIRAVILPSTAGPLAFLDALFWLVWWILVSRGLFKLARTPSEAHG